MLAVTCLKLGNEPLIYGYYICTVCLSPICRLDLIRPYQCALKYCIEVKSLFNLHFTISVLNNKNAFDHLGDKQIGGQLVGQICD